MQLFVIEDEGYQNFLPLTWTRPVYDLRCGMTSLLEKIVQAYKVKRYGLGCRNLLADLVAEQHPNMDVNRLTTDSALIINGRVLFTPELANSIPMDGADRIFMHADTFVAARLSGENLQAVDWSTPMTASSFPAIDTEEVDALVFQWPWDLVHRNADQIVADFAAEGKGGVLEGSVAPGAIIVNESDVYLASSAKIAAGVVLDAAEGPIFISEGVTVMANAVIEGPCYIGPDSRVKIGAKIYEGTSIGEVCKVGGEVEESIIHSYSNKQHDGFLGHAYVGQWVNLGAGTDNSDLKNDYGTVRVVVNGKLIDTGSMFVGSTIGDHTKTGIHTMLNTGTVIGVGCNIFGGGLPPKDIPSFAWGGSEGFAEYRFEKFISVAQAVMSRRKQILSPAAQRVLNTVFEQTAADRSSF